MLSVQHKGFWFQNRQLKKKNEMFGQKGGCNKTGFFRNLCFAKCQKVIVVSLFFWPFFGNYWVMFKNTIKIGMSAHL